jgi:hypothetical protein
LRVRHVKRLLRVMGEVVWWCTFSGGGGGAAHSQTWQERGLGAKTTKLSTMARFQVHCVKRWWRVMGGGGGMDDVVAVVGLRIQKHKAGEGLGTKSIKPSHYGSVLGCF